MSRASTPFVIALALLVAPVEADAFQESADAEWRAHGRDHAEQRYSPLDQISRENVGALAVA